MFDKLFIIKASVLSVALFLVTNQAVWTLPPRYGNWILLLTNSSVFNLPMLKRSSTLVIRRIALLKLAMTSVFADKATLQIKCRRCPSFFC